MGEYAPLGLDGRRRALEGIQDPAHWESAYLWALAMRAGVREGHQMTCDPRLRHLQPLALEEGDSVAPAALFAARYAAVSPPPHGGLSREEWRQALLAELSGEGYDWEAAAALRPLPSGPWWPSLTVALWVCAAGAGRGERFRELSEGTRALVRPYARYIADLGHVDFGVFIPGDRLYDPAVVEEIARQCERIYREHGGLTEQDASHALGVSGRAGRPGARGDR